MIEPDPSGTPPTRDQLMREAADWFVRMRGRDAAEHQTEFEAWIARGALHRAAYNRAAEIYSMGKVLDKPQEAECEVQRPHKRRWVPLTMLAATATVALIGSWVLSSPEERGTVIATSASPPDSPADTQLVTVLGESRTFLLADKSKATLGSDSLLVVGFDQAERNLRLHRGQARFDVAHEARPFVVHAGGGTITARGTVFDVAISADHKVTVSLVRGAVDVVSPASRISDAGGQVATVRLTPGQATSFEEQSVPTIPIGMRRNSPAPASARVEADSSSAAQDFNEVRLADVLAAANRVSKVAIRLDNLALGERRISGHFRLDDADKLSRRLAMLLDLEVDRRGTEIVLRSR